MAKYGVHINIRAYEKWITQAKKELNNIPDCKIDYRIAKPEDIFTGVNFEELVGVKQEPEISQSVKHEPKIEDSIMNESVKEEPVMQESIKEEPVIHEAVEEEPMMHRLVQQDSVKHEAVKQEPEIKNE